MSKNEHTPNFDLKKFINEGKIEDVLYDATWNMFSNLNELRVSCNNLQNNIDIELPAKLKDFMIECFQVKSEISSKISSNIELENKMKFLKQFQSQFLK